ncbi:MAG: BtrH N-terminal domain-containing protein, partial [Solirubrobacterales bacterium]
MAFGLGAGAGFYYLALDDTSPSRWFNGRTARLEETFRELTGAALELHTFAEEDGAGAWEAARATVDAGSPALLLTDIYHLDHYGNSAHFPGHAVVLAGYDDEAAQLSDTGFEELQTTRLENLARARHSGHPAYPLEGHMFTVAGDVDRSALEAAVPGAIARAASEMLEPPFGEFGGVPALERLAAEAGAWPEAVEDWQWCARFAYQVIERRGTGGGCFRPMYARFLAEAGRPEAPLAAAAGERWSELADAFKAASESDEPEPGLWRQVDADAGEVLDAERRLWTELSERV